MGEMQYQRVNNDMAICKRSALSIRFQPKPSNTVGKVMLDEYTLT
jgi:hypothetical protein